MNLRESSDPYYDLFEDYDLIVSSFSAQYGIRLYTNEFQTMRWVEFKALLIGLGPETPLGRIVSIRSEKDKNVLKGFTQDQHRIRNAWRSKRAKEISPQEMNQILDGFKNAFIAMTGKGG